MKFTLTYDGSLASNGKPRAKQAIREQIHPQLVELWDSHPTLKALRQQRHVAPHIAGLPFEPTLDANGNQRFLDVDLCEPVTKKQYQFLLLVRQRLALTCSLKIMFLRKEAPGRIYQGGDIDNRIKTLLDALAVPQHDEQVDRPTIVGMTHCLLEDDSLITGLDIHTHRLLGSNKTTTNEVRLIMEVDVQVTMPRVHNLKFLGG
jgi:hypothetical protein